MPNLVQSVKEMLKRGMSEQEIKQNLQELGVDDADSVYSQAVSESSGTSASTASGDASVATPSVSRLAAESMPIDTSEMENKLADVEAQVKALNEIMQKILDTDRQILLRLKGTEE